MLARIHLPVLLCLTLVVLSCMTPGVRSRRAKVVLSPCAPVLPMELDPQPGTQTQGPGSPACLPPALPQLAGAQQGVPQKNQVGDHEDPPPGELPFRQAFHLLKIRARLVAGERSSGSFIGGLTKRRNSDRIRVQTIRRLCGEGIASRLPKMLENSIEFQVKYRWCQVDPGDLVQTRCIKCDLVLYNCTLSAEDLQAGGADPSATTAFSRPVQCRITQKSFCEKDCALKFE